MIANLDNEVHFKQVFTDVDVFTAFVKDVLGIDIHINKVETEKILPTKVGAIKFKMDLFAEDEDRRTVVEIQKVDYDYTYDRFAHYFMGNLIDMQRSSKDYAFAKEVYIIVVVTSAYRISDKNGKPIKDDILITDINPRTLSGELRDMHNHKMFIINTTYVDKNTPQNIMDWADLITESMKNPSNPKINTTKPAIVKAIHLADINNLSPQQLADAKILEMRKATLAIVETEAMIEGMNKGMIEGMNKGMIEGMNKGIIEGMNKEKANRISMALKRGKLTKEEIAEDFEVSIEYIHDIERKMQNL